VNPLNPLISVISPFQLFLAIYEAEKCLLGSNHPR
jgi:hypothetical protein